MEDVATRECGGPLCIAVGLVEVIEADTAAHGGGAEVTKGRLLESLTAAISCCLSPGR